MQRLGSMAIALCVTLALFALMQAMIGRHQAPVEQVVRDAPVRLAAPSAAPQAAAVEPAAGAATLPPPPPPPPPLPSAPTEPTPTPSPPQLTPPPAIVPELARIDPGGKPYLGAVAKPKPKPKARPKPRPPRRAARQAPPKPKASARASASSHSRAPAERTQSGRPSPSPSAAAGRAAAPKPKAKARGATRSARPVSTPRPPYPRAAKRARQEGWVDVQFTIASSGRVTNVRVVGSSPRGVFDRVAQSTVKRWRFRPRLVNGKARSQSAKQRIHFRLR
jgi:protein TonB